MAIRLKIAKVSEVVEEVAEVALVEVAAEINEPPAEQAETDLQHLADQPEGAESNQPDHEHGEPVGEAVAVNDNNEQLPPMSQDEPQSQPVAAVVEETDTRPEIFDRIQDVLDEISQAECDVIRAKASKKAADERLEDAKSRLVDLSRELVDGDKRPSAKPSTSAATTATSEESQVPIFNEDGTASRSPVDPNGWRKVLITNLPLEKIEGLGDKKRESLIDAIPTLGALEDARVRAGASGLNTELPKGCGRNIADQLEELHLTWLTENRHRYESPEQTGTASGEPTNDQPAECENTETSLADNAVNEELPFSQLSEADQVAYIENRFSEIESDEDWTAKTSQDAFETGQKDARYGDSYADCVYADYDLIDDYLRGFLSARGSDEDGGDDENGNAKRRL